MSRALITAALIIAVLATAPLAWSSEIPEEPAPIQAASESLPDLVLWVGMKDAVTVRERMDLEVLVTNAGASLPASVSQVSVRIDFQVGQKFLWLDAPGPGEAVSGNTELVFLSLHPYEVSVCVDPENLIGELSKENNEVRQTVAVVEEKKTSTDSGGCRCNR